MIRPFFVEFTVSLMFMVLKASFRLTADAYDPFVFFRCRDRFREAFRQASGCTGGAPGCCVRGDECPSCFVFSQSLSPDPEAVKRHQKPPLPFAFAFPVLSSPPKAGTRLAFRLTIVGRATRHVGVFVESLRLLFGALERGGSLSAVLERVESLGYHDEKALVSDGMFTSVGADIPILLSADGLRDVRLLDGVAAFKLDIVTPLAIIQEGKALRRFGFSPFIRSIIRRVSSLASYYGDGELSADYKWLASLSEEVVVSNSSIQWMEWRRAYGGGRIGGLMGEAVLAGALDEFVPFLLMGEVLNGGKGASFGLGHFTIAPHLL